MEKVDYRSKAMGGGSRRSKDDIRYVGVHYSYTDDGGVQAFERHWKNTLNWDTGGYAKVILTDGSYQLVYDPEVITNGVLGHNRYTYHICYVGKGDPNPAQKKTLLALVDEALEEFNLPVEAVLGHREFESQSTGCPALSMDKFRGLVEGYDERDSVSVRPSKPRQNKLVRHGSKGEDARHVQTLLVAAGYSLPRFFIDSQFGDETKKAVKKFQRDAGIIVDGIVGDQTRDAFKKNLQRYHRILHNRRTNLMRGKDVHQVQRVVQTVADGLYGSQTAAAVTRYQREHSLQVDGIVGRETWGHMFGGII